MALPQTSLAAATAAGPGAPVDLGELADHHTMFVTTAGGASWAVALEGSHDAANWLSLGQLSGTSAGPVQLTVPSGGNVGTLVRYVRANVTGLSGGAAPTVTATIASNTEGD